MFKGVIPFFRFISGNRFVYPFTVLGTAAVSVISAVDGAGLSLGFVSRAVNSLPFSSLGFGWVTVTVVMLAISIVLGGVKNAQKN